MRWHESFVQEGRTQAKPMGGDQRSHAVEAQAALIRQTYEAQPGLFPHELRDRLAERGLRVGVEDANGAEIEGTAMVTQVEPGTRRMRASLQ